MRASSTGKHLIGLDDNELCAEFFGAREDAALLLIAGPSSPMDADDPELRCLLADGGRYVIRYNSRDTGESPSYPPGMPDHGFDGMVCRFFSEQESPVLAGRGPARRDHLTGRGDPRHRGPDPAAPARGGADRRAAAREAPTVARRRKPALPRAMWPTAVTAILEHPAT